MVDMCLACGRPLDTDRFAVYHGEGNKTARAESEEIAGHLCTTCAKKHKMKPVRNEHPFSKLAQFMTKNEGNV